MKLIHVFYFIFIILLGLYLDLFPMQYATCAAEQTQTVTRQSSTITVAPIQGSSLITDVVQLHAFCIL